MNLAVVGSRTISDQKLLEVGVPPGVTAVVSGGAPGADALAERYADLHRLPLTLVRPQYDCYQKRAPIIRNREIIEASDMAVILWDGESRGTNAVIITCLKRKKPFRVISLQDESLADPFTLCAPGTTHLAVATISLRDWVEREIFVFSREVLRKDIIN